jgi:hypothetical protein
VNGLLQRVEGEEPQCGLDRCLDRARRALVREQPRQGVEGHLAQPLALPEEPVLERRLLDREPLEEVSLVEGDGVRER